VCRILPLQEGGFRVKGLGYEHEHSKTVSETVSERSALMATRLGGTWPRADRCAASRHRAVRARCASSFADDPFGGLDVALRAFCSPPPALAAMTDPSEARPSVTLTTQCSLDRWPAVARQACAWEGPVRAWRVCVHACSRLGGSIGRGGDVHECAKMKRVRGRAIARELRARVRKRVCV
jgi:hypothetical protein